MNKKSELLKNTIIILVGKFCTQFITFLLLPLYTNILKTSEYGIIDIITTYTALVAPIISLQIELAVFRELIDCRNDYNHSSKIISNGFICIIKQLLYCLIIFSIFCLFINIKYNIYLIFLVLFTVLSNFLLQISRGFGKNVDYSIGSIIAGISTVVLNILFLKKFYMSVDGVLLSTIIANFLCCFYLFIKEKIYLYINIRNYNKDIKRQLLKYSMPLVSNGLIWWIISISDRTIITMFINSAANGIYAVSNKFSTILFQVYSVFNISWTESASLHINDKDTSSFFSDIFKSVTNISFSVCILLLSIMRIIFDIMIDPKFNNAYNYIPILLIGMFFDILVAFLGGIYMSKKLTKEISKTSFMAGMINVIINILLINKIGIYAAAFSTLLSFFIMFIYRIVDVQKYVKINYNLKMIPIMIVILIVSTIIYYYDNFYLRIINIFISILFSFFLNYALLSKIKNYLLKNFKSKLL